MTDTAVDIEGLTEAEAIVALVKNGYDDLIYSPSDWEAGYRVVEVTELDEGRWQKFMQSIISTPTGKFYAVDWAQGLTECQEQRPFEYDEPEPVEVTRMEKVVTVTEWVRK